MDSARAIKAAAFLKRRTPLGRVLVVEDDANAREALELLLNEEGYEVRTAVDGVEGLAIAETFKPDVVVTDVRMPKMGGLELRDALQAMATPPEVVLMSAARPWTGDAFYFAKPIDFEALNAVVRRLVSKRRKR